MHGEKVVIDPCINWLAGTTETWLKEVIDPSDIESGVFGRTVLVSGMKSREPIYEVDTTQYDLLMPYMLQKLAVIWGYEGQMLISEEAKAFEREWYSVYTKQEPLKSFLLPTWNRRLDTVHKLAMLLQCAKGIETDAWCIIPEETSRVAVFLYNEMMKHYEHIIDNIIIGRHDKRMEKVQAFLRKYKCVTMSRLQQATSPYGIRKDELKRILETLMEQNSVRQSNQPHSKTMIVEWIGE
jgi:Txe/YoeB family toxin of Txe-Axe toxin-antitoxin module